MKINLTNRQLELLKNLLFSEIKDTKEKNKNNRYFDDYIKELGSFEKLLY